MSQLIQTVATVVRTVLARIHELTFESFGSVRNFDGRIVVSSANELPDVVLSNGATTTWKTLHNQIVEARLRSLEATIFGDLREPLAQFFEHNDFLIDYPITPRLLHMDYHGGNILTKDGDISGIIDFEGSIVGHNEYDLMRAELALGSDDSALFASTFLEAYRSIVPTDRDYVHRREFYRLSRWLRGMQFILEKQSATGLSLQSEVEEGRATIEEILALNR